MRGCHRLPVAPPARSIPESHGSRIAAMRAAAQREHVAHRCAVLGDGVGDDAHARIGRRHIPHREGDGPLRGEHAVGLCEEPKRFGEVEDAESAGDRVDGGVVERKVDRVAVDEADGAICTLRTRRAKRSAMMVTCAEDAWARARLDVCSALPPQASPRRNRARSPPQRRTRPHIAPFDPVPSPRRARTARRSLAPHRRAARPPGP